MGAKSSDYGELGERERVALAGVLTSLYVLGRRGPRKRKALEEFFDRLQVSEAARNELRAVGPKTADPCAYAAQLRNETVRVALVGDLLALALVDGRYDARERTGIRRIAGGLNLAWDRIQKAEVAATQALVAAHRELEKKDEDASGSGWAIAFAVVGGAAALAITGGLAGPAIGGLIGARLGLSGAAAVRKGLAVVGGGARAAGGFGMRGGAVAIASAFGLAGGAIAGRAMHVRTGDLAELALEPMGGEGLHGVIAVSGWLSQRDDLKGKWRQLERLAPRATRHVLRWESKHLLKLGSALGATAATQVARAGVSAWASRGTRLAGPMLFWPAMVIEAINLIDNPWHVAANRAEKAGRALAKELSGARRPVTLVGFSLGGRVILHCLKHLAEKRRIGVIQDAILMGAAVTPTHSDWAAARGVVAGRLVNVYSTSDWVLGYLYRAAELATDAAGLGPSNAPGVEDVDVTDLADGHLAYADALGKILDRVGIDSA